MRFYTSDLHYFHKNIIEYCNRPFGDLDHMHEELIRRHNLLVKPEDEVWVLGDVAFAPPDKVRPLLERLNGNLILVRGNHDPSDAKCLKMGFHVIMKNIIHVEIEGVRVVFSHYPYFDRRDTRYVERRPKDEGHWLLHGHVHCAWKVKDRMINVGVDVWNYAPVSELDLLEIMKKPQPF